MIDLGFCKAKATALLDKHTSCAFRYEIEISEADGSYCVIRVCELPDDEAIEMGIRCPLDYEVILEASCEIELYRKIIARGGP